MTEAPSNPLVELIQARRKALLAGGGTQEQIIFLDNRLTPTPECILRDPVLNPYDKILWQGILSVAQGSQTAPGTIGAGAAMPTYDVLSQLVNVSRMSIATSVAALRATRWLIVNQIRDDRGSMRGQLYILAYQPWDLRYALDIDDRYLDWLETQTDSHRDRRVRRISQAVWDTIEEDRRSGVDITAPVDPIERQLEASNALRDRSGRFYAIGAAALRTLTRREAQAILDEQSRRKPARDDGGGGNLKSKKPAGETRVINSYSGSPVGAVRDSDRMPAATSSEVQSENTTTTPHESPESALVPPEGVGAEDLARIRKVLRLVPDAGAQQLLLDELGGRIKWGRPLQGAPAGWFKGLVQNFIKMKDTFVPNYADRYRKHREGLARRRAEQEASSRPPTAEERAKAAQTLEALRARFPSQRATGAAGEPRP